MTEQEKKWQQQTVTETERCINLLQTHLFKKNKMPEPDIGFDLKGRCAGQANYNKWLIRYNNELLQRYQDEFIQQVVAHEVAHLAVAHQFPSTLFRRRKIKPHGQEWKAVMTLLNADATTTHRFETQPQRQTVRLAACCDCEAVTSIGKIQAARLQRGERKYYCRQCRSDIRLLTN